MLSNINFNFRAFCPICKKTMQILLITERKELHTVLAENGDVKVMHPPSGEEGDHVWSLSDQDKSNLRNQLAKGLS